MVGNARPAVERAGKAVDDRGELPIDEWHRVVAGLLFAVVLAVYALTLCPTVPGGDSGELITVAATTGIAHPPGYPTHAMLGKLFSLIPYGSVAWRVNLLSAVCNAAAALFIYIGVFRITHSVAAAVLGGAALAFAPLVWSYATVAEVFGLHNLFISGAILLLIRLVETRDARWIRWTALWFGLSMTNHHTAVLYALPIGVWLSIAYRDRVWKPRVLASSCALVALGMLPYLYLPVAGTRLSVATWGDFTTLEGFLTHLLRREYGTLQLGHSYLGPGGELLARLGLYARDELVSTLFAGPLLAAIGLIAYWKGRFGWLVRVTLAAFVFYLVVFCYLSNLRLDVPLHREIQARFWQQAHVVLCVWLGLGWAAVTARTGVAGKWLAPAGTIAFSVALIALNYGKMDQSRNDHFRNFARSVLDQIPARGVLVSGGDFIINSVRYVQQVEGYRRDIPAFDRSLMAYPWHARAARAAYPDVTIPGNGRYAPFDYALADFVEVNRGRYDVFGCGEFLQDWDRSLDRGYATVPWGFLKRIAPVGEEPPYRDWARVSRETFEGFDPPGLEAYGERTWEWRIGELYWTMRLFFADHALVYALEHLRGTPRFEDELRRVTAELEENARSRGSRSPNVYKNLGIAYLESVPYDPSARDGAIRAWNRFLRYAPEDDPDRSAVRSALSALEGGQGLRPPPPRGGASRARG